MNIQRTNGFTLIELMIVVAVVTILAAVSYPSFTNYVRETHRKEAAGEVLDIAAGIERIKAQRFSYSTANGMRRDLDRYQIEVEAPNPTAFTITATPTGDQVNDRCMALVYDQDNNWSFRNGDSDLGLTQEECIN